MSRVMKDSEVEWIGDIPQKWPLRRMKSCIASRESGAWGEEPCGDEYDTICLRIADFNYEAFRFKDTEESDLTFRHYSPEIIEKLKLQEGDVLIEKSGGGEKTPVGRSVVFDKPYKALYANFMERLRCTSSILPYFLQYVFVTFYKNEYTRNYIKQTTGIQNLDLTSMLAKEFLPLPDKREQFNIIAYLDHRCAEIDRVIAATQRTIEEYKKLKQSIITEAVTRGVRGPRKMKDSGVEWIGEIPEEWDIVRLKFILSSDKVNLRVGPFGSSLSGNDFQPEGYWVYNQRIVLDNNFEDNNTFISKSKYEELKSFEVLPGDILITTRGSIGKVAIVPTCAPKGVLHPCVIKFRISSNIYSEAILRHIFNETEIAIHQILDMSNSTTIEVL